MSERAIQECPICGATQPLSARRCSICGAVLPGERTPIAPLPPVESKPKSGDQSRYDPALGDDDLYAGDLSGRMWRLVLVGGVILALAIGLAAGLVIGQLGGGDGSGSGGEDVRVEGIDSDATAGTSLPSMEPGTPGPGTPTAPPTATPRGGGAEAWTATANAFQALPTVTPLPPSATPTPTPGPCYQTAQSGDTVLGMAMRCGHKDMSVIDMILELNDMQSAQELKEGQTLEIPWPTPTGGPPTEAPEESTPAGSALLITATPAGDDTGDATPEVQYNEFGTPDALAYYSSIEPTLRPGLAWHQVAPGETIMGIAYQYETSVETLSQINPEVPFRQCDYGMQYGGENCSVMLYEGQSIRVPVPIPTSTPTATPNGTFTPTPSYTPTYNAPYLLKPEDGAKFMSDEFVTLRWGGTGTLGEDQRYIVRVRDMEANEMHIAQVRETSYQLPGGWQPSDNEWHTFEWTISVGVVDDQQRIVSEDYLTDPRRFTWNSR